MKSKAKKDSSNRRRKSTLTDVDSRTVSNDDYFRMPEPPRKEKRSHRDTESLLTLDTGVLREISPPCLNGQ